MAKVVLPLEVARAFAGGVREHEVDAADVRELMRSLERRFPDIAARLAEGLAVAIDGEIFQEPFLESIGTHSEVYFLPKIEGG